MKSVGKRGLELAYAYAISGHMCFDLKNYGDALEYYTASETELNLGPDMGEDEFSLYFEVLWRKGAVWYALQDYEAFEINRLQLLDIVGKREGQSGRYAALLLTLGEMYLASDKDEEASKCYMSLLDILEAQYASDSEIKRNELYRSILGTLSDVCGNLGMADESVAYTNMQIDAMLFAGDTLSEEYMLALERKYLYHSSRYQYADVKDLLAPLSGLYLQYYGYESDKYGIFLGQVSEAYILIFDYDSAFVYGEKYREWVCAIKGLGSIYSAFANYNMAVVYYKTGNSDSSWSELRRGLEILENVEDSPVKRRTSALFYGFAGTLLMETDPSRAAQCITQAIEIKRQVDSLDESAFANLKMNLGGCYIEAGQYEKALSVFQDVARLYASEDRKSVQYLSLQHNIGLCQIELGKWAEGAATLEKAADAVECYYGTENELYMDILNSQSIYYSRIFDYANAIKVSEQAAEIAKNIFGLDDINYGKFLLNLGLFYQHVKAYRKAENVLLEAVSVVEKALGSNHVYNAYIFHNLGNLYFEEHRQEEGIAAFGKSMDILLECNREKSFEMFFLMLDYGRNLILLDNPMAATFLKIAKRLGEELELAGHPAAYLQLMAYCLGSSLLYGPMGDNLVENTVQSISLQYRNNISLLTASERQQYWTIIQNLKSLLFSQEKTRQNMAALYDYLLLSKGLLLGTSISFESLLASISEVGVLSAFGDLKSMRTAINRELSRPVGDHTQNVDSLLSLANILERELIFKTKAYGDYSSYILLDFADVSAALEKHEVAVEFVNYIDFSSEGEMVYAAMLTRHGWNTPKFIRLCKGTELEKLISQRPKMLYSAGYVATELYNVVWKPLAKYVKKGDVVYFSPSGMLYKLAIESICNDKGQRLDELYEMKRSSSTRDIVMDEGNSFEFSSAVLYGGIVYDRNEEEGVSSTGVFSGGDSLSGQRAGWEYLPGTKAEVESIGCLLDESKIDFKIYEGERADEESFGMLSGEEIDVLHIATHGFFVSEEMVRHSDFYMNNTSLGGIYRNLGLEFPDSPYALDSLHLEEVAMLRSGLILAGGNRAWKGAAVPVGMEDGVLTASEISLMDFRETNMVILSACETGLGEISDEGVWGLQRAFKKAGVKTVVMSLWKVDDRATSLMMTEFYRNLLAGELKREAFQNAQSVVREKYEDPFYWAAFIMLD